MPDLLRDVFVIDAVRTPIGRVNSVLANLPVEQLLAPLIKALLSRNVVDGSSISEVIVGNAAGPGGNPARLALLSAGLPVSVPGMSIDRQCGSGLEAINTAARLIQAGVADWVIAGGVESPSTAPLRAHPGSASFYQRARFAPESLGDPEMGEAAENVARKCLISRERQDAYALHSHQKAITSASTQRFAAEIVPVQGVSGRVSTDECPRPDTSLQKLAALPPLFAADGTVTAGNACPVNDGAALVLLSHEKPWTNDACLRFAGAQAAGVEPTLLGLGPVPAVRGLLSATGCNSEALAQIEFNEAFAAQVLACLDELALDPARVNPGGGALALGHPYGASGAVLVTRLLHDLRRDGWSERFGLATLGIGGGLGLASLFEAV